MKQYTKMWIVFILMCLVIATGVKLFFEGCLEQQPQLEAPSLLGSKITEIEAHNYEGDYLIIRINDSNAELEIVVKDEDKYAYRGVKEVHIEQILDELNSFTELFNMGITAEHVEMPRERAMSSDYDILIYLADGRFYLISQVMNAPIQVENKTTHKIMFYLKPYSINYTQPIQEIGAKVFDLQLPIQKKFFESGVTYISAQAHNTIDKETPKPATLSIPTVAVEKGTPIEYIEMPTELPVKCTPDWKLGDWWVVKTEFHPPEWPDGHGMFKYKYVVVKCEEVVSKEGNQKTFYKVKRTSADKCCEDSKYWTDLYFVKDNTLNTLSLYRAETHGYHRGNKTTAVKEYGTIDSVAPVMRYPCSIPVFPLTTEKRVQSFELVERCDCTDILTQKIEQEVSVYNKSVYKDKKLYHIVGKRIFATTYKVKLTDEYGDSVTQYWHPSAPWTIYEDSAISTSTLVSCSEWESSELPKKSSELLKE